MVLDRIIAPARDTIEPTEWDLAWNEGSRMTATEAIALARTAGDDLAGG